ncbi:MAG TPA: GTP 3',8-cyclase MoaA [Lentimicrobium sp.]|nr:GTP 3',8-cyclase MoaA [Lentimicrobium sp.]
MKDKFNRNINYLRISVTDRCNLRCTYCMPEEGVVMLPHEQILTFEEIFEATQTAVSLGISKVRITGGEPLVRKGIIHLIEMLASIDGINDLSMTTNGILLKGFAKPLKEAGLHRVNVSLDTMNPIQFRQITRGGDLWDVIEGIDAAISAGLTPVKLNCVVKKTDNDQEVEAVKAFANSRNIQVRFIRQMNLKTGTFSVVQGGSGGDCTRCNRIRLTANGKIKPCLFNDQEYSVRELGAAEAITRAVTNKPSSGTHNHSGQFYNIGG